MVEMIQSTRKHRLVLRKRKTRRRHMKHPKKGGMMTSNNNQNNNKQNIKPHLADGGTWMKLTNAFLAKLRKARQTESIPDNIPERLFELKYVESNANMDSTFGQYIKWRLDTYAKDNNLWYEDYSGYINVYNLWDVFQIIVEEYDSAGEEIPAKMDGRRGRMIDALEKEWEMVVNKKRNIMSNNSDSNNNSNNNNFDRYMSHIPYVYGKTLYNNGEQHIQIKNMIRSMYLK